ncbi:MAG: hypothetical protein WBY94_07975 [Polyangiaceae bacterium]
MNKGDVVLLSVLLLAFAALVTVHVTITVGLLRRRPRWHALLAFAFAPLAPYYAAREHMRTRAFAWVAALAIYAAALVLAAH